MSVTRGELASLVYSFYLGVAVPTPVQADRHIRYTLLVFGTIRKQDTATSVCLIVSLSELVISALRPANRYGYHKPIMSVCFTARVMVCWSCCLSVWWTVSHILMLVCLPVCLIAYFFPLTDVLSVFLSLVRLVVCLSVSSFAFLSH